MLQNPQWHEHHLAQSLRPDRERIVGSLEDDSILRAYTPSQPQLSNQSPNELRQSGSSPDVRSPRVASDASLDSFRTSPSADVALALRFLDPVCKLAFRFSGMYSYEELALSTRPRIIVAGWLACLLAHALSDGVDLVGECLIERPC